ncbi:MAG: mechanosensitive ion channel, partial [Gemmatimonadota bacterium]|nr:mechanosensitive ion channel [Gemmatimonadota bacterium]
FNSLGLALVSQPLQTLVDKVLFFLPNLVAGGVLAFVAWVVAILVRKGATAALGATQLDDRLSQTAGMRPVSGTVGDVLYWIILLLFLPAVLGALELQGLLEPVQGMIDEALAMVPNIFSGAILAGVGWFLATLLRNLVTSLLSVSGADRLGERAGLRGTMPLSRLAGLVVFVFVFVPALIAALNAVQIDAIAGPATEMLGALMAAIPRIFAAAVILGAAFLVAGFVSDVISSLLGGIGFDQLPGKLGLRALPEGTSPSRFVGRVLVFFIMLFATVEAASMLGFTQMSDIVAMLIQFAGDVLLGAVVIAVGLWIANLTHAAIMRQAGENASFLAGLARLAILGIVFAMGLSAMNIAQNIVDAAFYLTLGAVAVAAALSFGLGGREAAGKQMEHWLARLRREEVA